MRAPFVDPFSDLGLLNTVLPLVGRDSEMQLVRSLFESVALKRATGACSLIVTGEIGIGKSRLLRESCLLAGEYHFTVLEGKAYEAGSMFPYLPFIEALRPLVRASSEEALRRYVGLDSSLSAATPRGASEIISLTGLPLVTAFYQLFPELSQKLHVPIVHEILSPDQEKFRLFDAVATLLERVAMEQPLLLCLDNLQWADSASLELTMYLTVRLHGSPVALLGATRPPQRLSSQGEHGESSNVTSASSAANALRILSELMQQGLLLLLPLAAIDEDASAQHLQALLPGILPETIVQSLLSRAGGNPFFLEELVRMLCFKQRLVLRENVWQLTSVAHYQELPDRVTLAVSERLQGLASRELLQVAALFGQTFPLQVLAQVLALSEDRVQVLIEDAIDAAILARVFDDPVAWPDPLFAGLASLSQTPLFLFGQRIVQEVLAAEIPAHRRRQLHGKIGAALEAYYGPGAPAHAAELARHYVLSDQQEAAFYWSLLAGEDAVLQQAHREAISHLQTALRLLDSGVRSMRGQSLSTFSQLYLALGESWLKLGELEQAAEAFHQATIAGKHTLADDYSAEEYLALAKAHRLLADAYRLQGKYELALAHLELAAEMLGGEDDVYNQEDLGQEERETVAASWLGSGRGLLQRSRFSDVRSTASLSRLRASERLLLLQARAMLDLLLFRFEEAEKIFWQVHQLGTELGDRGSQAFALHILGWLRGWGEHIGEAIRLISQAHELYIAIGDPFHAVLGDQSLGIIYQALGEMEEARRYNRQGSERARRYGVEHILGWLSCNQGIMALAQGAWEESEAHLQAALAEAEKQSNARIKPLALQCRAILSFRKGDWQMAEQLYQAALQAALNSEWYPSSLALYGHFLAVTGYRAAARVQLDLADAQVEPFGYSGDFYIPFLAEGYLHLGDQQRATRYTARIRNLHGFLYYGISVDRILGEVAASQEDWQAAELAFEDGLALCQRSCNQPEEAFILYEQARTALMRSQLKSPAEGFALDQRVHELCNRARELFQHYGMQRFATLVDTLQEGMRLLERPANVEPSAVSSALVHREYQLDLHLTKRELEVLRLVAEGRTDREVADVLVLSPRTVNRHLSNIFVKLDVPGRASAVAYAIRQRLVD